ncbi:MAG: hypothetical protein ACLRFH_00720 [Opitutales bacterium]
MKNKIVLVLSGLIVVNTVLGKVGGEEDVFATKDVFGSNEAQPVHQETTTTNEEIKEDPILTNEELKVQIIPSWEALREENGFVIQKGMDQYIIEQPIRQKLDFYSILAKLTPLHTDKAKKLGKKPIIFKYQMFGEPDETPIKEKDEFSVESFMPISILSVNRFGEFYNALSKYGKPIVFNYVKVDYRDKIEKTYDLSNCKITYSADVYSFDEYLKLTKLGIENLKIWATINFKPCSLEQNLKENLEFLLKATSTQEIIKNLNFLSKANLKQKIKTLRLKRLFKFGKVIHANFLDSLTKYNITEFIKDIEEAEKFPITDEKELKKQLHAYTRDKHIEGITIKELHFTNNYEEERVSIPIEYATCLKLRFDGNTTETQLVNPKNTEDILFVRKSIVMIENVTCNTLFCNDLEEVVRNVSCKTIILPDSQINNFINYLDEIKNLETIWLGIPSDYFNQIKKENIFSKEGEELIKQLAEKNISLQFYNTEKRYNLLNSYEKYMQDKNIIHLSGYVNIKNKPDELSDEEWKQVLVLKQKLKKIIKAIQSDSIKVSEIN